MICVLHFAISLPTDTAVQLSNGEDGLLRGEYCTEKLNVVLNVKKRISGLRQTVKVVEFYC
jgi:hypothetical protein